MKPILRWAGGKRRMLKSILPHLPEATHYHEPFVGGGAVFFNLEPAKGSINDTDERLIRFYRTLAWNTSSVINKLNTMPMDKESYLNYRLECFDEDSDIDFAAKYIYFNKLCFGSLMRFNSSGKFNVPFGNPATKSVYKEDILWSAAELLQKTLIFNVPFEEHCRLIMKLHPDLEGHLFYFDPPYVKTATTIEAYSNKFTDTDTQILRDMCLELFDHGASVIVSNNEIGLPHFERDFKCYSRDFQYSVNQKYTTNKKKTECVLLKIQT